MPGIDPARLARVLRQADSNNIEDYLTAAAELEERDGQYGPQIAVRRTAVSSLELAVYRPNGATARAARAAQDLVDSKLLKPFISHALDALGKGFAISEIVWKDRHGRWCPTMVEHDQREFQWHEDREEWRLRDYSVYGAELIPGKWVVHQPKLRAGVPIRRGLARPAMFLHMCKSMSLAGWVTLMQVFGVPIAIAAQPENMTDADAAVLRAALAGLGQGINAIVPHDTDIKLVAAASQGSPDKMFSSLLDYVDKQISKLVLGQTMTTDNGSSHAQATVHNDVRKDIREGDAEQLEWTINEFIVKPYIDFNVGEQKVYPEVFFDQPDSRDLQVWSTAVFGFADRGLPVKADEAYAVLGLTRPEQGDEVLSGKPGAAPRPAAVSTNRVLSTRARFRQRAARSSPMSRGA